MSRRLWRNGKGVVIPGCPACRKRINTIAQFLDHLADDVMPSLHRLAGSSSQSDMHLPE
jgi:hypothetical protein